VDVESVDVIKEQLSLVGLYLIGGNNGTDITTDFTLTYSFSRGYSYLKIILEKKCSQVCSSYGSCDNG
jgi:hypothetical protein